MNHTSAISGNMYSYSGRGSVPSIRSHKGNHKVMLETGSPESDRSGPVRPGCAGGRERGAAPPARAAPGSRARRGPPSPAPPAAPPAPRLRSPRISASGAPASGGAGAGSAGAACFRLPLPLPRAAAPAAPRWDKAASDSLAARVPLHLPLLPPPTRTLDRKSPLGGGRAV
ncbi:unnamed protein product, partial [Bubo scandiacus]